MSISSFDSLCDFFISCYPPVRGAAVGRASAQRISRFLCGIIEHDHNDMVDCQKKNRGSPLSSLLTQPGPTASALTGKHPLQPCHINDITNSNSNQRDHRASSREKKKKALPLPTLPWDDGVWAFLIYWCSYLSSTASRHQQGPDQLWPQKDEEVARVMLSWEPLMPARDEIWRQPALIAALCTLAADLWTLQAHVHRSQGEEEEQETLASRSEPMMLMCPLCHAAALDHTVAVEALLELLKLHVTFQSAAPPPMVMSKAVSTTAQQQEECTAVQREALFTHGVAACRVAAWNGSPHALRLIAQMWMAHPSALYLFHSSDEGCSSTQYPGRFSQHLMRLQCTLWLQEEAVCHSPLSEASRCEDDVIDSYRALRHTFLHSSSSSSAPYVMFALKHLWVALMIGTPYVMLTDGSNSHGATYLTWLCGLGYERAVREVLVDVQRMAQACTVEPQTHSDALPLQQDAAKSGEAVVAARRTAVDGVRRVSFPTQSPSSACDVKESGVLLSEPELSAAHASGIIIRHSISTALQHKAVGNGFSALDTAVAAKRVDLVRQLVLGGASVYACSLEAVQSILHEMGEEKDAADMPQKDLLSLLYSPGAVLDSPEADIGKYLSSSLCASASADVLAQLAARLWKEKVQHSSIQSLLDDGDDAHLLDISARLQHHGEAQDRVLRPLIASLAYDAHHPTARLVLISVLARKLQEFMLLRQHPRYARLVGAEEKEVLLYYTAVQRMYEQLTSHNAMRLLRDAVRVRCELMHRDVAPSSPLFSSSNRRSHTEPSLDASLPGVSSASEQLMADYELTEHLVIQMRASLDGVLSAMTKPKSDASASYAEAQLAYTSDDKTDASPAYALVNIPLHDMGESHRQQQFHCTSPQRVWVRLPVGMDFDAMLSLCGGAYGLVDCDMPLTAPVERGDLVAFVRQTGPNGQHYYVAADVVKKEKRFDVQQRDGFHCSDDDRCVELPCVVRGDARSSTTRLHRVSRWQPHMHYADPVISGSNSDVPLKWLEVRPAHDGNNRSSSILPNRDVITVLRQQQEMLQRWCAIVCAGSHDQWLREVCMTRSGGQNEDEDSDTDTDMGNGGCEHHLGSSPWCVWRRPLQEGKDGSLPLPHRLAIGEFSRIAPETAEENALAMVTTHLEDSNCVYVLAPCTAASSCDDAVAHHSPQQHWEVVGIVPRDWGWH